MDVDSGIETMEVDDQDVKFEIKRRRVKKSELFLTFIIKDKVVYFNLIFILNVQDTSIGSEATVEQVTEAVSRVFLVSWKEDTEEAVYLPPLAECEEEGEIFVIS